jgi:hypothetical protein
LHFQALLSSQEVELKTTNKAFCFTKFENVLPKKWRKIPCRFFLIFFIAFFGVCYAWGVKKHQIIFAERNHQNSQKKHPPTYVGVFFPPAPLVKKTRTQSRPHPPARFCFYFVALHFYCISRRFSGSGAQKHQQNFLFYQIRKCFTKKMEKNPMSFFPNSLYAI